jgi:cytosine/uracil/thiamine/allantoin permease
VSAFFANLYDYAWFIALGVSAVFYAAGMRAVGLAKEAAAMPYAGRV